MARQVRTFNPEERSYNEHNLYCYHCGNTNQWQIDLRLKHQVECLSSGLSVCLSIQTRKILKAIENNIVRMVDSSIDNDKGVFKCPNCSNEYLDFQERTVEVCYWNGCPGCFHCGNWISEEDLLETCSSCISDKRGIITEDDCDSYCMVSDFGLREVMDHHGTNLTEIKESLGWF